MRKLRNAQCRANQSRVPARLGDLLAGPSRCTLNFQKGFLGQQPPNDPAYLLCLSPEHRGSRLASSVFEPTVLRLASTPTNCLQIYPSHLTSRGISTSVCFNRGKGKKINYILYLIQIINNKTYLFSLA